MSKNYTPLWREAHFTREHAKKLTVSDHFLTLVAINLPVPGPVTTDRSFPCNKTKRKVSPLYDSRARTAARSWALWNSSNKARAIVRVRWLNTRSDGFWLPSQAPSQPRNILMRWFGQLGPRKKGGWIIRGKLSSWEASREVPAKLITTFKGHKL